MTVEPNDPTRQLATALQALHKESGAPSMRMLAERTKTGRTTVNDVIRGARTPSKDLLLKIVRALGGDQKQFETLWENLSSPNDERPRTTEVPRVLELSETAASDRRGDVSVFLSYARIDDESTYRRISTLISDIANTYESLTGNEVGIFQDTTSIALGEDWKDRIRLGLKSSSILIAVVTPAYLRSRACREEFTEFYSFLETNASTRLILPLLFSPRDRLSDRFAEDEIWGQLSAVQSIDVSLLRTEEPGNSAWLRAVSAIAERIDEILDSLNEKLEVDENIETAGEPFGSDTDSSVNMLQRFADLEEGAPDYTADLESFGRLINALASEVDSAGRRMTKAQKFGQKLSLSNRLAFVIDPIAEEMLSTSERLHSGVDMWSHVVRIVIQRSENTQGFMDDDVRDFLQQVESLASNGLESLSSIYSLATSINDAKGLSSRLDKPLGRIQEALLKVAGMRAVFGEWLAEIDILKQRGILPA